MQQAATDFGSTRSMVNAKRRNVGAADRVISAALGGLTLLTLGRRRGLGRLLAATAGTLLVTRAATGHSQVYEATGISSAPLDENYSEIPASVVETEESGQVVGGPLVGESMSTSYEDPDRALGSGSGTSPGWANVIPERYGEPDLPDLSID